MHLNRIPVAPPQLTLKLEMARPKWKIIAVQSPAVDLELRSQNCW
jgi:hypothetical protein